MTTAKEVAGQSGEFHSVAQWASVSTTLHEFVRHTTLLACAPIELFSFTITTMAKMNNFSGDPEMVDATEEGPPDPSKLEIETQHSGQR